MLVLPTKSCLRHRYSAIRKAWVVDRVEVKMEAKQFAAGAMRACFRLKKLSTHKRYTHLPRPRGTKGGTGSDWSYKNNDWGHALNYVAKKYMEPVPKEVYFEVGRPNLIRVDWRQGFLAGCEAANGREALGGGVQPPPAAQESRHLPDLHLGV